MVLAPLVALALLSSRTASAVEYTHAFSPTAVYLRGSGWEPSMIKEELEKTQRIFDQCGIKLDPVKVVEMEPLDGRQDIDQQYDLELVTALGIQDRPLVFFLRSVGIFLSHGEDFAPGSPMKSLTNTSWLGLDLRSPGYKAMRDPSYSPVAHEIAHVLCDCGHVEPGQRNLLAGDASFVNDRLTPQQCEDFKKSPLVRSLGR